MIPLRLFISYRRADSQTFVGRIYDRLCDHFEAKAIFRDIDRIAAGVDFRDEIEEAIKQCDVLLVVIGPNWLNNRADSGSRRLDQPNDFVRLEIEKGLSSSDLLAIPVLLDNAAMPSESDLPASLQPLAYLNAIKIRNDPDFNRDMARLLDELEQFAEAKAGVRQQLDEADRLPLNADWDEYEERFAAAEQAASRYRRIFASQIEDKRSQLRSWYYAYDEPDDGDQEVIAHNFSEDDRLTGSDYQPDRLPFLSSIISVDDEPDTSMENPAPFTLSWDASEEGDAETSIPPESGYDPDLGNLLGFTEDDLDCNRYGQVSTWQKREARRIGCNSLMMLVLLALLIPSFFLFIMLFEPPSSFVVNLLFVTGGGVVAVAVTFVFKVWENYHPYVRWHTGELRRIDRTCFQVGDRVFNVRHRLDEEALDEFLGTRVRVYYLGSRIFDFGVGEPFLSPLVRLDFVERRLLSLELKRDDFGAI